MANTLTPIIRNINVAFAMILAEKASLPALVDTDFSTIPAALGQAITTPFTPVLTAGDRTPAVVPVAGGDQSVTTVNLTITKDRTVKFNLTGDDYLALSMPTLTPGFIPNSLAEAMRVLRNEIHADCASEAALGSSGAVGTAGTDPFGSDLTVLNSGVKLLDDALAPITDRNIVISTSALAQIRGLGFLVKANEAASDQMLRKGLTGDLVGLGVTWDQTLLRPAVGTGTAYVLNGAVAVGDSTIVLKTGSGTILAGDLVTIAGDSTIYVVAVGIAAPGTITLVVGNRPGNATGRIMKAAADGAALTVLAQSTRMPLFHRQGIKLCVRPSAMPPDGDMAAESTIIQDPVTGCAMRLAYYKGYGRNQWELQAAWGKKAVRPELIKTVLGA